MAIFEHQELLSDGIARLVGTLVRDQSLAMKTIGLPNVRLTAWGDARIEGLSAALSLDDGFLRIEVSGSAEHKDEIFRTCSGTTKHQELHADAEGELILRATDSNWWSSTDTHGFQAWRWSLVPPNAPSLWFGRLHGLQHGSFLPWHNLQRTKPQSIRELYLAQEEGYDYAIIRLSGDNPPYDFLLVDTKGAGAPEPETLLSDLRVLEFLHARHLKLDALQGVSKNGDTVAFAGVFTGIYQGAVGLYADFPLPAGGQCWIAPGFSNLAPLVRNPPRSTPVVRLAMRYFLSSFDGSPHEAYLKLTVALEGLALEVIADRGVHEAVVSDHDGKRWIVRDPLQWRALVRRLTSSTQYEEWRKFVKSHELEIKEQVLREEWSESLLKSFDLKHDAGRLPAGKNVTAACLALGLQLDGRMAAEAKRWNTARHTAVTAFEPHSTEEQIAVLRAMLVAMLMKWSGYGGPTIGYRRNLLGFWPALDSSGWGEPYNEADARASRTYYLAAGE